MKLLSTALFTLAVMGRVLHRSISIQSVSTPVLELQFIMVTINLNPVIISQWFPFIFSVKIKLMIEMVERHILKNIEYNFS